MANKKILIRTLYAGEALSFDDGRIQLVLVEKSGRRATLQLVLHADVHVDKPAAANDPCMPTCKKG